MKSKKFLFMISHPAHYHMFKFTMANLSIKGHKVVAVIRPKDVLEQLCINDDLGYYKVDERPKKWGLLGLLFSIISRTRKLLKIVREEKPDLLIGSDGIISIAGRLRRISAIECFEDDAKAIKLYALLYFPLYHHLLAPEVCDVWVWNYKKTGYNGYHELGYLHPNHFTPNKEIVEKYFSADTPYFVIRFAKLTAHHDVGIEGFTFDIANKVIEKLKGKGEIYITSERELEPEFEKYRIEIDPIDMHHILAFASLYIGDSQTMAAEAGVLGTPFVRFNDFVGELSYLNEIENDYHLGYGHKTNDVEGLYSSIQKWINTPNRKQICSERRQKMLSEKIDYAKFLTWFIENYPESKRIMKETPEYQNRFK